jgi:predicted ATPase/DNA-binding NarL/FixJ family response regulator
VGEAAAPIPIRSARVVAHNLPAQFTSIVGREHERAAIAHLLRTRARLVTLTGAGGVGKTRLAQEVSGDLLDDYRDGAWLVELGPLTQDRRVPQAVAAVLGVHEEPGRELVETLAAALRQRQVLLILDNCEHLLQASGLLVRQLLSSCPALAILATSREPLGLPGETTWRVPSLDRPDPHRPPPIERLLEVDSVRLFAERAMAAAPDFRAAEHGAAIAQICCRLDGIPLALELAAARVAALDPAHIAARLDDRFRLLASGSRSAPQRQQTLRATIDWSYELLSEPERRLLERLAVFGGGWTLETAEVVCSFAPIAEHDVADLLSRLVDKSLVIVEDVPLLGRWYRLLETMRAYALERLAASGGESEVRARHLAWYTEFARDTDRIMRRISDLPWAARKERACRVLREIDNIRAAWTWSSDTDHERGLRLAGWLFPFIYTAGFLGEGREWLAQLLDARVGAAATSAHALGLSVAAKLAAHHGDDAAALEYAAEYQGLPEALRSAPCSGDVFAALAIVRARQGDFSAAHAHGLRAVELALSIGDLPDALLYRTYAATAAYHAGRLAEAGALYQQSLTEARSLDFQLGVALALDGLATVARATGDLSRARLMYAEALVVFRDMEAPLPAMQALIGSGHAALQLGDAPGARSAFDEALEMGLAVGQRQQIVHALDGLVLVALAQQHYERTITMAAALGALRAASGTPVPAAVQAAMAEARRQVGARAESLVAKGHAMTVEQAIACAREDDIPIVGVRGQSGPGQLTLRELEVVRLLGRGLSNREIATELVISVRTVDRHVENVLDKLRLASRSQVVAWAAERGLLVRQLSS